MKILLEDKDRLKMREIKSKLESDKRYETEIKIGDIIKAPDAKIYICPADKNGLTQYYAYDPFYRVLNEYNGFLQVRWYKLVDGITGWFKKSDVRSATKPTMLMCDESYSISFEVTDAVKANNFITSLCFSNDQEIAKHVEDMLGIRFFLLNHTLPPAHGGNDALTIKD